MAGDLGLLGGVLAGVVGPGVEVGEDVVLEVVGAFGRDLFGEHGLLGQVAYVGVGGLALGVLLGNGVRVVAQVLRPIACLSSVQLLLLRTRAQPRACRVLVLQLRLPAQTALRLCRLPLVERLVHLHRLLLRDVLQLLRCQDPPVLPRYENVRILPRYYLLRLSRVYLQHLRRDLVRLYVHGALP